MNSARYFFLVSIIFWGMMAPGAVQAQETELTGPVTEKQILENDRIYEIYIDRYTPDSVAIDYLMNMKEPVKLMVFLGSWCRESKKYIPRLMKSLREADAKNIHVEYVGVNAQKNSPESFLNMHQIKYIPTVVVLKGDKEIGRIVEEPQQPIELELMEILEGRKN
ncbi:MAG: hypothetical protein CL666_15215 [Balneola sp.]|nr:hypothetical protein [Balneola sp.]